MMEPLSFYPLPTPPPHTPSSLNSYPSCGIQTKKRIFRLPLLTYLPNPYPLLAPHPPPQPPHASFLPFFIPDRLRDSQVPGSQSLYIHNTYARYLTYSGQCIEATRYSVQRDVQERKRKKERKKEKETNKQKTDGGNRGRPRKHLEMIAALEQRKAELMRGESTEKTS